MILEADSSSFSFGLFDDIALSELVLVNACRWVSLCQSEALRRDQHQAVARDQHVHIKSLRTNTFIRAQQVEMYRHGHLL